LGLGEQVMRALFCGFAGLGLAMSIDKRRQDLENVIDPSEPMEPTKGCQSASKDGGSRIAEVMRESGDALLRKS
jgi:hypothetical protein